MGRFSLGIHFIIVLIGTMCSHSAIINEPTMIHTKLIILLGFVVHMVIPFLRKQLDLNIQNIGTLDSILLGVIMLTEAVNLTTVYSYPFTSNTIIAIDTWGVLSIANLFGW